MSFLIPFRIRTIRACKIPMNIPAIATTIVSVFWSIILAPIKKPSEEGLVSDFSAV
jgi:hypothetical protein